MVFQETDNDTATAQAQPGQFGAYYLQELINKGGMAEIWLATDGNRKPYAVRLLRNASVFNFTARKRFLRGCDILSKIHNHNR